MRLTRSPTDGAAIDYDTFTDQTVSEAVDLTNLVGADAPVTEEALTDLLHLYGLRDDPVDVDGFVDLARRLRTVFEAPDVASRLVRLNALIAEYEPRPTITEHDGQDPHFHFVPDDGPDVRRVGASLTMALAHVVVDYGADRLGRCPADGCANVFVDHTRNRSQRFCSKTCATRVHVAAHRARQ